MDHTTENLEHYSADQNKPETHGKYVPRPKRQLVGAWILIAIVVFAFLGMCYWMVAYGRV